MDSAANAAPSRGWQRPAPPSWGGAGRLGAQAAQPATRCGMGAPQGWPAALTSAPALRRSAVWPPADHQSVLMLAHGPDKYGRASMPAPDSLYNYTASVPLTAPASTAKRATRWPCLHDTQQQRQVLDRTVARFSAPQQPQTAHIFPLGGLQLPWLPDKPL